MLAKATLGEIPCELYETNAPDIRENTLVFSVNGYLRNCYHVSCAECLLDKSNNSLKEDLCDTKAAFDIFIDFYKNHPEYLI